jgi:hypothetical protein
LIYGGSEELLHEARRGQLSRDESIMVHPAEESSELEQVETTIHASCLSETKSGLPV